MRKNQNFREEKGITLVALVVTIVVLLILAGISISMVLGENGLIARAKDSKTKTEQDQVNTETGMNNLYEEMEVILGNGGSGSGDGDSTGNSEEDENTPSVVDPYEGQTADHEVQIGSPNKSDVVAYLYLKDNGYYDMVIRGTGNTDTGWNNEDGEYFGEEFMEWSNIEGVYVMNGVTSISDGMFANFYSSITEIILPKGLLEIGEGAFFKCRGLTEITIPASVTSIGNNAFNGCKGLTEITIPSSVTSIEDYAFSNCNALTDVYYSGTADDWEKITIGSSNTDLTSATIHYNSTGPESN